MDIRRLEVFCKVVELKSFTKAAEAALLSQPTVSEQIRLLEESFDEKLLDRLGREVLPTGAGDILYQYARRIIRLRDEAVQAIDHYRGRLSGQLWIGASTIPGAYILPQRLEPFKARCPDARLTLKISGSGRIVEQLIEGSLEIGIIGAPWKDQRLECDPLFEDELVLTLPPGHPWAARSSVSVEELAGEPFILRESGSGTRMVMEEALSSAGFDPGRLSLVAEMGSTEAVRQGIKARIGISILSSLAVAEDLRLGTLVALPLEGLRIRRPFYLIQRKNRQLSPLANAFLDHLKGKG